MGTLTKLICLQFIFQTVYSQCVNRVVQGPNGPIELLPNQVLLPPGVPYLGPVQGQQSRPCQAPQPVVVPASPPIPTEYSIPSLPPVLANFAPPPNVLAGNVIVPNIPSAIPNVLSGNTIIPSIPPSIPNVLSGNMIVPNIPSVIPNGYAGNMIVPSAPVAESYIPTVVHDNSVANSLANALQLLVVSSLLSNTLPEPYEPPCYDGYAPGYGYIY